ncbi:hypothetical protein DYB32_000266 [Aphanomyces invadans]|uniref:SRP54-type proteins GTP-binding domain-containing protein n=1 Tax=Aphanomyces invadans TaxID=157072 RepID=A0A3R6WU94_9STRA|nr:hypothetical protein DYB32_000266 [Aphanomyces invadans]
MCKLRGNPVDHLVKTVLLEERLGRKEFNYESYQMRWSLENKLQLVLVVVYQKVLQLLYVDELLERLKREVVAHFADDIRTRKAFASFDKTFDRILRDVESGHLKTKRPITAHAPAVVSSTEIDLTRSAQDDGNGDDELEKLKHDLKLVGSSGSKQPRTMRTGPRAGKKKGSKKDAEEASLAQRRNELIGEGGVDDGDESDDEQSDTSNVSGSDSDAGATGWSFGKTRFGDFLQSISGNKDVAPIVEQFRQQVQLSIALEAALLRILTPKKSTDVLREVLAARDQGRCFSIVFVGVNGVGKSTSLSKVCYYLKSRGVKDPASVAKDAIAYGNDNGFDCVLIDTAGRMQNNEPLMRALAKLVSVNNPDLVLFVGEALVGNDGIDQLSLFDRVFGAAVSMVYKTGQPIMFVGTGQKYTHLAKLNVKTVLRSLLN